MSTASRGAPKVLARVGARLGWTPREIERTAFSAGERLDLSNNLGLSRARFSVLRFPHHDKERFVNTLAWGALSSVYELW